MPRDCSMKSQGRIVGVPFPTPDRETLHRFTTSDVARFWSRVTKTAACWLWTGYRNSGNGYGQMGVSRKVAKFRLFYAHRIAWELTYGPIPEGQSVLHHCDVPACVNPDHLFVGTQTDNMRDASRKGRLRVPRPNGRTVTDAQVSQIRVMAASGKTQAEAALACGVTKAFVSLLLSGKRRQHQKGAA